MHDGDPLMTGLDARVSVRLGTLDLAVDLRADDGSVVAVLGPNGAGKTTLLRCLAGLIGIDDGHIRLGDTTLDEPSSRTFLVPERRGVGVMFQDYLLFPHLSARDNVAFGLRSAGRSVGDARAAAEEWLARFGLAGIGTAKPRGLSGGQAQRVALARALAPGPALLLLDEPLAALDAGTRVEVRRDLRRHLAEFGGPTVLVTHDPVDALTLADQVVILEAGRVIQAGALHEVTTRPRSRYVANLIGTNLLAGDAVAGTITVGSQAVTAADRLDGPALMTIAPSAVALHRDDPGGSPRNHWPMVVVGMDLLGDRVRVALAGDFDLVAEVTPAAVADLGLVEGDRVVASVKATEVVTYPA